MPCRFRRPALNSCRSGRLPAPRKAPWRRTLVRTLLYGRNVDRAAKTKARLGLAILVFGLGYGVIAGRMIMFVTVPDGHSGRRIMAQDAVATARPDILDRNGEILATDVRAPSLFAEPNRIIDVDEAAELLTGVLPDLDAVELRERLGSKRHFVWLKRDITPKQRAEIYRLGLPGIGFLPENKRVYPNGNEASHLTGLVNIDNQGIAGIEKWLDGSGLADLHMAGLATDRLQEPVKLAVDLRVQHALRDELMKARDKFKAKAAAGLIVAVRTGEIVSMVSVPDFDPNNPREALDPNRINRLTTGVYEMGSTFKALTLAMALNSGKIGLNSTFDARVPLHFGKFADSRLPSRGPLPDLVGGLHLFLQHRRRAHRARHGGRRPQGVPEEARPARPLAHRAARKRRADRSQALGRAQHHHHRVRPRAFGRAAASRRGDQRAHERRLPHSADLPATHRGAGAARSRPG